MESESRRGQASDVSEPGIAVQAAVGAAPQNGALERMRGGTEWLVDAFDCDAASLRDAARLRSLAERVVKELALNVLGAPLIHQFGGHAGVTGLYLLSESHLAWHTYPESGLATYNLYCCRDRPALDWGSCLKASLGARRVTVRRISRGSAHAESRGCDPTDPEAAAHEGSKR